VSSFCPDSLAEKVSVWPPFEPFFLVLNVVLLLDRVLAVTFTNKSEEVKASLALYFVSVSSL
jgi:hypothetical protein